MKAGVQSAAVRMADRWIPAFAGMTSKAIGLFRIKL